MCIHVFIPVYTYIHVMLSKQKKVAEGYVQCTAIYIKILGHESQFHIFL